MKPTFWSELDDAARAAALSRPPRRSDPGLVAAVAAIVEDVRTRGWDALASHAVRIDGAAPRRVAVAEAASAARATLTRAQVDAIMLAHANVTTFHAAAMPRDIAVETMPGLLVRKIWRPIDRVGLYVPGGETPLFSTLLMLALPARAAGVREIVVATPPRPDGSLDPVIGLAAELCGIDAVWTMGGAQAIAALAFGAGEVPRVDKILGPGNAWVSAAKTLVGSMPGGPAIDLPAGPSELMVIADRTADSERVAADLLSQAEHDPAAQVILVTPDMGLAGRVRTALVRQAESLPRRAIALASLEGARIILVPAIEQAVAIANDYAPEHLHLSVAEPDAILPLVRNAGAVFAGHQAAEAFGDYLAGSSHVLPTDGAARAWSGISVESFLKATTVQTVGDGAAAALAGPAALLARLEGLEAHARAADARLAGAAR